MSPVQFGWALPSRSPKEMEQARFLATVRDGFDLVAGVFDSAWMVDHLQFGADPLLEGWTTLAYLAAEHQAFRFGHAVLCQSFRNPALLAKMAATLQYLSAGRFILGLGTGWHEEEYKAYGYDFPSAGVRLEELDETLQIVKALWQDEQATVEGKHYRVAAASCEPKPDPLPPIMVGAFKPQMLRLTARHADWWSVSFTPIEDYRPMAAECERACAAIGRDPATLRRTWFGGCVCAPSEAALRTLNTGNTQAGRNFVGTPAQVIAQLRPFVDLGVDYFMLNCGGFPDLTTLRLLRDEVLPALQG